MPRVTFSNELNDFIKAFHAGADVVQNAQEMKLKKQALADKKAYYDQRNGPDPKATAVGADAYNNPPFRQQSAVPTQSAPTQNQKFDPNKAPAFLNALNDKYALPPGYMAHTGWIESKFDPNAHAKGSSAAGMFQFTDGTAKQYGLTDRYDALQNAEAAARLAQDNRKALAQALGRDPTPAEIYLAHQQGAKGAAELLRNPNAPAASLVGRAAVVNNGGNPDMTAGQFADLWLKKYQALGASRGGMIRNYAEGGLVAPDDNDTTEPDNDEDDAAAPMAVGYSQPQAPEPAPEATPGSNLLDALPSVIKAGLTGLQDMLGLRASAAPSADHQTIEGARALYTGAGAPPPEQVAEIDRKIDPEGRLDMGMRNIARISAVYQYYVDKGDMKKAQLSAGQLLQASFLQTQRLGALALTALQDGQPGPATQALIAAYNTIPDGKQASVQGDHVVVTDQKTGKPVQQFKLTPQILLQAATGLTDGSAYYNQLMAVASGKPSAPQEEDDPAFEQYMAGRSAGNAQPPAPQGQAAVPTQGVPSQETAAPPAGQAVPTEGFVSKTPRPQLPPEPQPGDFASMNKADRAAALADYNAKRHQWELARSRSMTEYDRQVAEERKGYDEEQRTIRSRDLDTRKPHHFDLANPENLAAVDDALGWTDKGPPSDPTVRDGVRSLVGSLKSYNPGMSLQAATTALAVLMSVPQSEKDQPFNMEKGDEAYGTVRFKFKDKRIPPVSVPKDELDVLVAMRGLVAQRMAAQSAKTAKQEKANSDLYSW